MNFRNGRVQTDHSLIPLHIPLDRLILRKPLRTYHPPVKTPPDRCLIRMVSHAGNTLWDTSQNGAPLGWPWMERIAVAP